MEIIKPSVELLNVSHFDPEKFIEMAGRTCYKSENKITEQSSEKFCKMLIKNGHHSVLEHITATFKVTTNRGVTHEIVRHRLASYSQESTRYISYDNIQYILPDKLKSDPEVLKLLKDIEIIYKNLKDKNIHQEYARDILPNCLKTELIMTANIREWRHFIQLRSSKKAHPEIRIISNMILEKLKRSIPSCFQDL